MGRGSKGKVVIDWINCLAGCACILYISLGYLSPSIIGIEIDIVVVGIVDIVVVVAFSLLLSRSYLIDWLFIDLPLNLTQSNLFIYIIYHL